MADKSKMIHITACGETREYPAGTSYGEIARDFAGKVPDKIMLIRKDCNKYLELMKRAYRDEEIDFITLTDKAGQDTYNRGACLMMLKAFYNVLHGEDVHIWIRFAVSHGLFCTISNDNVELTQELLDQVKAEMENLRDRALPFEKRNMPTQDAVELFQKTGMEDKARLFSYRIASKTNIYSLSGFNDYYFGDMPIDSSCIDLFDLKLYKDGFVLLLPTSQMPDKIHEFAPVEKLFDVQNASRLWCEKLDISTVGDLNDMVTAGKTTELLLMQEALQEKTIGNIASQIADRKSVKVVLIAGPSSSGKTTFSYRLSTQLSCYGLKPHPFAMDNYFKNRDQSPRNPDGSYNFECLEALDVEQFNQDINDMLAGRTVRIPTYNFIKGEREYKGNTIQLGERDVLVVEGIHGLNEQLSYRIPHENKFKIYISALTQLNIDEHNRIPTTDGRLLRRIVRDQRTRGYSAKDTIEIWKTVRRGEEQYIFPYQESADVMFNSALIYELAVLKTYALPMLFAVPRDCPEWTEASRLLKFLDYFMPIPAEDIPKNSLVREFIGGGIFNV